MHTLRSVLRVMEAQAAKKDPSLSGGTMYTEAFHGANPSSDVKFISEIGNVA